MISAISSITLDCARLKSILLVMMIDASATGRLQLAVDILDADFLFEAAEFSTCFYFSGNSYGFPLRFPDDTCFWSKSDKDVLTKRIDSRVDQMIERGTELDYSKEK